MNFTEIKLSKDTILQSNFEFRKRSLRAALNQEQHQINFCSWDFLQFQHWYEITNLNVFLNTTTILIFSFL